MSKSAELTDDERRAIEVLMAVYKIKETPSVGNWILRCMGLLKAGRSAVRKLGW